MVGRGKKGRYVNGLLKTAKSFIQYCYDEEYGGFNTKKNFKWCKEEKVVIITFKPSHVRQMMTSCGGNDFLSVRDKAVLSTLFETGIRCWELCCIKPEDIHDDYIVITSGKNHKQRVVPITPILKKALMRYEAAKAIFFTLKPTDDYWCNLKAVLIDFSVLHRFAFSYPYFLKHSSPPFVPLVHILFVDECGRKFFPQKRAIFRVSRVREGNKKCSQS